MGGLVVPFVLGIPSCGPLGGLGWWGLGGCWGSGVEVEHIGEVGGDAEVLLDGVPLGDAGLVHLGTQKKKPVFRTMVYIVYVIYVIYVIGIDNVCMGNGYLK